MVSTPLMTQPVHTQIKINNLSLHEVFEFKFLGIYIDSKLKWKEHIDMVKSRISLYTGILYRLRHYLNVKCLLQVYFTLIYPHLLYCSSLWGGAYKTFIDSLFISQKKLLRVMFFKNRYDHTISIFRDFKLLKLPDIILLQTNLFVHKSIHSLPLDLGFRAIPYNVTRRPHDLRIPLCRTSHAQQSILSRGTKSWNNLPEHFITDENLKSFKRNLIKSMLDKYNENL